MDYEAEYQNYSERMQDTISGMTKYAAFLSAQGKGKTLSALRELMIDMCWIWEGYDSSGGIAVPWNEFLMEYLGPFDRAVKDAQINRKSPTIAAEEMEKIFYGVGIHILELIDSCENLEQAHQWMELAAQMNEQWKNTVRYPLFYQMINGPLWEGEVCGRPVLHMHYDIIPSSIVPKEWHCYHLCKTTKLRLVNQHPEKGYVGTVFSPYALKSPSAKFRELDGKCQFYFNTVTLCEFCQAHKIKLPEVFLREEQQKYTPGLNMTMGGIT